MSNNVVHYKSASTRGMPSTEMPLFRKFPEIRKFQIERKNFRKNEIMSLDKIIDQKGGKRFGTKENVSKFLC